MQSPRTGPHAEDVVPLGDGYVDLVARMIVRGERREPLTAREHALLVYLVAHPGEAVSRHDLHRDVWGVADAVLTRAVDFTVSRLRQKLERDPAHPEHLRTVHGIGYTLARPAARPVGPLGLVVAIWTDAGRAFARDPDAAATAAHTFAELAAQHGSTTPLGAARWRIVAAPDRTLAAARAIVAGGELAAGAHVGAALDGYDGVLAEALAAAAWPGQVLASHAARTADPDGEAHDLGDHDLPGFDAPQRLWSTGTDAAPPRVSPRTNLPIGDPPMIGRDAELAVALAALAARPRVVTLVGPGGIGKSRLAREVAVRARGGGWLVECGATRSTAEVVAALARTLRIPVGQLPEAPALAAVARRLGNREPLVAIFDGVEGVVHELVRPLAELVERAPHVGWIVTSRVRAALVGEVVTLHPLEVRDRERLLVARAREVRPRFATTPDERAAAARLAASSDGLPLAIELLAGRARDRTAQELLDEGPAELSVTVARSIDALSAPAQRALAWLSAAPGGFPLEAAERLVPDDGVPPIDRVGALRDASLLSDHVAAGRVRLAMTDSVRSVAAARLGADRDDARTAVATWLADVGEGLRDALVGRGGEEAGAWLEAERTNLLEANPPTAELRARLALVAAYALERHGPPERLRATLDAALADPPGSPSLHAKLRIWRGDPTLVPPGDPDLLAAAANQAATAGDLVVEAEARVSLGLLQRDRGDLAGAVAHVSGALALARAGAARRAELRALTVLGGLRADPSAAEGHARDGLALARELGHRQAELVNLVNLAEAASLRGVAADGVPLLDEAVGIAREIGDPRRGALVRSRLGSLERELGRTSAGATLGAAIRELAAIGDDVGVRMARLDRAALALELGDVDAAETELALADGGPEPIVAGAALGWALAALLRGRTADAVERLAGLADANRRAGRLQSELVTRAYLCAASVQNGSATADVAADVVRCAAALPGSAIAPTLAAWAERLTRGEELPPSPLEAGSAHLRLLRLLATADGPIRERTGPGR